MNTTIKFLGIILILLSFLSCSKDNESNSSSNDELKVEKGYATGKVTDAKGNPLAGVKILLDNTVYYASYIHGSTQEDGTYKIKVQPGSWQTFAYIEKMYNGQAYSMELFPDKTDVFAEEGAVRNFTWKLEGRMPWEAEDYYGCTVKLRLHIDESAEDVELTFTPDGTLIDGSVGRPLTMRYEDNKWQHRHELWDIPLGRYTVTAILKKEGGNVPLKIQNWPTQGDFVSELQLDLYQMGRFPAVQLPS